MPIPIIYPGNPKFEILNELEVQDKFEILNFGHCDLFDICDLLFVIL
jgi:hypothetical protein